MQDNSAFRTLLTESINTVGKQTDYASQCGMAVEQLNRILKLLRTNPEYFPQKKTLLKFSKMPNMNGEKIFVMCGYKKEDYWKMVAREEILVPLKERQQDKENEIKSIMQEMIQQMFVYVDFADFARTFNRMNKDKQISVTFNETEEPAVNSDGMSEMKVVMHYLLSVDEEKNEEYSAEGVVLYFAGVSGIMVTGYKQ